jgi:serine/threonine protein kinase
MTLREADLNTMPLSAGDKLGPYEILAPIGAGGMGEVYKARDTRLGRMVAVKVLPDHIANEREYRIRFEREARAVASLNHPHICTLHDVGPNYLVMELLNGAPLKCPLPVDKAVEYAGQILDALDAAHRNGITHRDLKPANIFVTDRGIKLLDFGLAKLAKTPSADAVTETESLTRENQIAGTLQYMSPEQLRGFADARSDIFSFGAVFYEMLSGKRAFPGASVLNIMAAIMHQEPDPLQAAPALDPLIRKCLAKNPDDRIQSVKDLKYYLTLATSPSAAVKPATRLRWLWPALAALGAAAATYVLTRTPDRPVNNQAYRVSIHPPEGTTIDPDSQVAVSPDGRQIAYVGSGKSGAGLWVQSFDRTQPKLLPGTENGRFPIWSPDNRSLAFQRLSTIMRTELAGGDPVRICTQAYIGGLWTQEGNLILGTPEGLMTVPASGGDVVPLTRTDSARGEYSHNFPYKLPGGRIIFRIRSTKPELSGIYVISPANPKERNQVVTAESTAIYDAGALLWARGTSLVAQRFDADNLRLTGDPVTISDRVGLNSFGQLYAHAAGAALVADTASKEETQQLTWLDRQGKPAGTIGQPAAIRWFRFSPDGSRIAASLAATNGASLWLAGMGRDPWVRFTFLPGSSSHPIWTPSGENILFQSQTPSNFFSKPVDATGEEVRITKSPNRQWPLDWSRDGRLILYYETRAETQRDLWTMPVDAGGKPDPSYARPYLQSRFNEYMGRFYPEPNPRWIAYLSNESGREEVYIQGFPEPSGKKLISTDGGTYPEWSPDGRELYYISPDFKLMAVSLSIAGGTITPSRPAELFPLPLARATSNPYAIAPDGKRFLVPIPAGKASAPLEVIINWPAMLSQTSSARR